jgi:hypothetical protein
VLAVPQSRGFLGTSEIVKSTTASVLLYAALMLIEWKSESLAETIGYQQTTLSVDMAS